MPRNDAPIPYFLPFLLLIASRPFTHAFIYCILNYYCFHCFFNGISSTTVLYACVLLSAEVLCCQFTIP
jgi:hypothetical protein